MSFVLDNSVTMRWFFLATANHKNLLAGRVLDAMKRDKALVPAT
ncbi:hypothetical protein GALL_74770 [mine drainage metagenome]|uniref:Uncharacterized protein n=1 Tax=mine drainage metagenome TaxID=410659 RepID=A0A1J5SRT4_9ZZZZ